MEQPSHLTIKDIGVILERLSAKIVDVERLERDVEGATYNWTIKVRTVLVDYYDTALLNQGTLPI